VIYYYWQHLVADLPGAACW